MKCKCNMGKADRIFRVIVGLIVIALGIYFKSWWGAIGLLPLITASVGHCPAYVPLGISTKCETTSDAKCGTQCNVEKPETPENTDA